MSYNNDSLTSDNDTAHEDEDELDVPQRKKKSSRYSSKRFAVRRKNKDGGYASSSATGGVLNDSDADDESRSISGFYDGASS